MLRAMAKLLSSMALVLAAASPSFTLESSAYAQAPSAPASAAFPPEAAPTPAPAPLPPPVNTEAPAPVPAPAAASAPAYPVQPTYTREPPPPDAYPSEPPPPPRNPDDGFQRPEISVRIDPFNFLLEGRLGLEIESQLYKFLTLEIVPVFVTTNSPPTLNYNSYEKSTLHQKSNGIGAISGAAIDAGLWFGGKPFNGYVMRAGFTNYAYSYETTFDGVGGVEAHDSVSHTDRQFFAMFGSHNRWGAFTIAGGIGLAYELNRQNRCFQNDPQLTPTTSCKEDGLNIKLDNRGTIYDLHSFLYPFDLLARFSLGVVF